MALAVLAEMAQTKFGDLVKAVVDVERGIMAIDAELHADEEALLLEHGSAQRNLWGINLFRPSQGNRSRGIDDPEVRRRILVVVDGLILK